MRRLPHSLFGRSCPCGAQVEQGAKRCPKCRHTARWYRRKSLHDGL
jgi:hypothetical protein